MSRNARLRAARLWMHDRQCTSGPDCTDRDDHARRTQHEFARTAEAAPDSDLAAVIHDHACYAHLGLHNHDGCANRPAHIATAERAAQSLAAALKEEP